MIETGTLNELRHLTRTSLAVETKQPLINLNEMRGVHGVEKKDRALSFQVDAEELDNVIKYVSRFGILSLVSTPPTLEDLFMRHYEGAGKTPKAGVGGAK